ncbi:hypothetical protein BC828DRAFT_378168 [Blastocladiella britannica]|nr:hypothetical protein BC828DRAFT_378168 [Blastocladiella britannica]
MSQAFALARALALPRHPLLVAAALAGSTLVSATSTPAVARTHFARDLDAAAADHRARAQAEAAEALAAVDAAEQASLARRHQVLQGVDPDRYARAVAADRMAAESARAEIRAIVDAANAEAEAAAAVQRRWHGKRPVRVAWPPAEIVVA